MGDKDKEIERLQEANKILAEGFQTALAYKVSCEELLKAQQDRFDILLGCFSDFVNATYANREQIIKALRDNDRTSLTEALSDTTMFDDLQDFKQIVEDAPHRPNQEDMN